MTLPFDDDPAENAWLGLGMVDTHCAGCADFHLASLVRRAALPRHRRVGDQEEFSAAIRRLLEAGSARSARPLHIVIAGSTDTWLYSVVLNAACAVGGEQFARRLGVEIVDQCETPLELCRRFAAARNLDLITGKGDIAEYTPVRPADLVLMHGLLPFFPAQGQLSYLRRVASWLSETGILLCSNQHGEKRGGAELNERISFTLKSLDCLLSEALPETAAKRDTFARRIEDAFRVRQNYNRAFVDEEDARRFFARAGLELRAYLAFSNQLVDGQRGRYHERVILECGRAERAAHQPNSPR